MNERFTAADYQGKKNRETTFIFTGNTPNPSQLLHFLGISKYFNIRPPKRLIGKQFHNKQLTSLRRANIPLNEENEKEE
jgi:hypothetical protein